MIKDFMRKVGLSLMTLAIMLPTSVGAQTVHASESNSIILNGTVDVDSNGYLNPKSTILSAEGEVAVNFRLAPEYASGAATGVRVHIYLPSLKYEDGEYKTVGRDMEPTALGVQGRVSAGGEWTVIGDTTSRGGVITMEYIGDLRAGSNPAFDIMLSTYNDGSEGVYGSVPEGTTFELNGYIEYEMFNREEGTYWKTNDQNLDDESRVTLISSDLKWDKHIESVKDSENETFIPIWDRYQYAEYDYTIENNSDNLASDIDGFQVTLDIDATDSSINGIIPFDVNRFSYVDGQIIENEDIDSVQGQFIGVKDKGGVLIYDITDWDGESELTETIPYVYSGSGSILFDQTDEQFKITPEHAEGYTARKYRVMIPLSRQGFPDLPTLFKVRAITNITFAKGANWSKTKVNEREIMLPTYSVDLNHEPKANDVVYSYDTYLELNNIKNTSNVPIHDSKIKYTVDKDYKSNKVEIIANEDVNIEDFVKLELLAKAKIKETDKEFTYFNIKPTLTYDEENKNNIYTFDITQLDKAFLWEDYSFEFALGKRIDKFTTLPFIVRVHGAPERIGDMKFTSTFMYDEHIANNDDLGQNTTYELVPHEEVRDATINVIYPDEIRPTSKVIVNGKSSANSKDLITVKYDEEIKIDVEYGVNKDVADNSTLELIINEQSKNAIHDVRLELTDELKALNPKIVVEYLDGTKSEVTDLQIGDNVHKVIIDTEDFGYTVQKLFSVYGNVNNGLVTAHEITSNFRIYQRKPYDVDRYGKNTAYLRIQLPNELRLSTELTTHFGDLSSKGNSNVAYESDFTIDYAFNTADVNSPEANFNVNFATDSKTFMSTNKLVFNEELVNQEFKVILTDTDNKKHTFIINEDNLIIDINKDIKDIDFTLIDFKLNEVSTLFTGYHTANQELGKTQVITSTVTGSQEMPYVEIKKATFKHNVTVAETKTTVGVSAVHQVNKDLGVGNSYDMKIYKRWSYYYNSYVNDYTLDMGYKTLGGFVSSVTRPTATYHNNNQKTAIDVELPHEHFDLYYIKIREEMKDYIDTVDIYRLVDGKEVLWQTIDGKQWVYNTTEQEKFWRINTAHDYLENEALFSSTDDHSKTHDYYKTPWDEDVHPETPVARVVVNLEFERLSNNDKPQMSGTHTDVIEYFGRFYKVSDKKETTTLQSFDKVGEVVNEREHKATINSLVGYPYAQTTMGVEGSTGTKAKTILMSTVGEYVTSITNNESKEWSWSYAASHGPDIYVPAATEWNEWLQSNVRSSHHDNLLYEFIYPANKNTDDEFYFEATHITVSDINMSKYLTKIEVIDDNKQVHSFDFTGVDGPVNFKYAVSEEQGIVKIDENNYIINLNEGVYPTSFTTTFSQINGIGENTSEISGMKQDLLGSSGNLDIRVGGYVQGNKDLVGKSNLYRSLDDRQDEVLMNSNSSTLKGYTPKLGATLAMDFDTRSIYDYKADGLTPNENEVYLNATNSQESDIKDIELTFTPDVNFRTRKLFIPEELFDTAEWTIDSVMLTSGTLTKDVKDQFIKVAGGYELMTNDLFNDTFSAQEIKSRHELIVKDIKKIVVTYKASEGNGLFGSFSKELDDTLQTKLHEKSALTVTGDWVDESTNGHDWNSKPTFVNENTKASNNVRTSWSTFNVSAVLTPYESIWVSAGGGNNGQKPTYTRANTNSIELYNRVAQLNTKATILTEDNIVAKDKYTFYDKDTDKQVAHDNITVGDTTKVLYEISNIGKLAEGDNTAGALPAFKPIIHIELPKGLKFVKATALTDELNALTNVTELTEDANVITNVDYNETEKLLSVEYDTVLDFGEKVYLHIEVEAINDFGDLNASQNKSVTWNAYVRPAYTHNYMSYNSNGVNGSYITGTTATKDFDNDKIAEHYGQVYNTAYRFANPNKLKITSVFNEENISGKEMTLTIKDFINEIDHSNTHAELFITLDRNDKKGFELTEFPVPTYPDGFVGEFDKPKLYFKYNDEYVLSEDFNNDIHNMLDINELKVDYGIIPDVHEGSLWQAPSFTIKGIGHWATTGADNTKSYDNYSVAEINLTHDNELYKYSTNDFKRVYKAMPTIGLNLQTFDTKEEALASYNPDAVGKVNYIAGDEIWHKITAENISTNQGVNTNTPYGKAPLLSPVIVDKIPEYLVTDFGKYIDNNVLDVSQAINDGLLTIRKFDKDGNIDFKLPTATVEMVTSMDTAGAQSFAGRTKNDGWGHLSNVQPENTTVNKANEINYLTITYSFDEKLDRNERLEIVYNANAREHDLPFATYEDGKPVYAPYNGWYGNANPTVSGLDKVSMDMASLLHDVGITGDKGHEMTSQEFLSSSHSYLPGNNTARRYATSSSSSQTATFYDMSANKDVTHKVFIREADTNDLYEGFTSGAIDGTWKYGGVHTRVNDNKVTSDERILWTQDGMQLSRAWIYSASEMVPDIERKTHGVDSANFYEYKKSLNNNSIYRYGYSPYIYDDYVYGVQLHEEFTMKLHAVNVGDRAITNGIKYTSVLPFGITPYDRDGNLNIQAYDGQGNAIDSQVVVIQTPENDKGYRVPLQSMEAGTYKTDVNEDHIPYVVEIVVDETLTSRFRGTSNVNDKYQSVHMRVRVYDEPAIEQDELSYFYDKLTVELLDEEYYEVYDNSYGAFNHGANLNNKNKYNNDSINTGFELAVTDYYEVNYSRYFSFEPYGMYVRGLNAQSTVETVEGKKLSVTGDKLAMRKPTLRVWNKPESLKDGKFDKSIEDFQVNPYEEFIIHGIVENQQLETQGAYNRKNSGYNYYSGDNLNDDIWVRAEQTIGGARGTYFEPKVTMVLPTGIVPMINDKALLYDETGQDIDYKVTINNVSYNSSVEVKDITDLMTVEVTQIENKNGKQYVLKFSPIDEETVQVNYNQSIVVSPKVKVIATPDVNDVQNFNKTITIADTYRNQFNPIVSGQYVTGSVPTRLSRDTTTVVSQNGSRIDANDRNRLDSTSTWNSNMGKLKITEQLIDPTLRVDESSKHENVMVNEYVELNHRQGALGATTIKLKNPSIKNKTTVVSRSHGEDFTGIVDPASKYWYVTEIKNESKQNADPYKEGLTTGDVMHSQFMVTYILTNFAELTGETQIKLGDTTYSKAEYEKMGYKIEQVSDLIKYDELRNKVHFIVTTPQHDVIDVMGQLKSGESFKMMAEAILVNGYDNTLIDDEDTWSEEELIVHSYVSMITDNKDLIIDDYPEDLFIVQNHNLFDYDIETSDKKLGEDLNDDNIENKYAYNKANIEILKPKAEVRKNTTKPRSLFSNGLAGDAYFNLSDTIEYMITYANVTGSGLKEFVIEDILPTHVTNETSMQVSRLPINTQTMYISTGKWELPEYMVNQIEKDGKNIDDLYKTYVYISHDLAEDGYETDGWTLMNPQGTSILTNEIIELDPSIRKEIKKVRIVVKALDDKNYLVPTGIRLDIDADKNTEGKQEVIDIDPDNMSVVQYESGVTDNAIKIGMRVVSDTRSTLHIYNTAQAWGNYVGDTYAKLAQSETRSYLTPSRPIVNVDYNTKYFRYDGSYPADERFGWSDITTIAPQVSPHLKFSGEFINADKSMWGRDEDNTYVEDALMNPFVTFEMPTVMKSGDFTYVPYDEIDENHKLHNDYRSKYSLTEKDSHMWTWHLEKVDGSIAELEYDKIHTGPWRGSDRNHVSVWFKGIIYPGDKIVVEFIGEVDGYAPGLESKDLKSRAMITNNTGLLQPLNSRLNTISRLGYDLDPNDFNDNKITTDRFVFEEQLMFQFETYDNFGKSKHVRSDLNLAGTTQNGATPVGEGQLFTYKTSVDNTKEVGARPYPYPIIYDVLPYVNDKTIMNDNVARNSQFRGWLQPDTIRLFSEGTVEGEISKNDYTVYVGPFKKTGSKIEKVDLLPSETVRKQDFYNSLNTPKQSSVIRDANFVKLTDLKDEAMIKDVQTILVMMNDSKYSLEGRSKLTMEYSLKAPLNTKVYLQSQGEKDLKDYTAWNSFTATQKVDGFIPQESNIAGVYVTEQKDKTYIGNYVWNDYNLNGKQDEGTLTTDENGRKLLVPTSDNNFDGKIDDPGINKVKVSLLTNNGHHVDKDGQPIKLVDKQWLVIDNNTGEIVLDDVFLLPIESDGPLVTFTESDVHGNMGYYTFSNIPVGTYRVAYEFTKDYDKFDITTRTMFKDTEVEVFRAGVDDNLPFESDKDRLVVISKSAYVSNENTDEELMNFDLGVGQRIKLGGFAFKEKLATLDGRFNKGETKVPDYHIYLKTTDGNIVTDSNGNELVAVTDKDGNFVFDFVPTERQYFIEVTDENNSFNDEVLVSPIIHNINPLHEANVNDAYTPKGEERIVTNIINLPLNELYNNKFADQIKIGIGLYDKTVYGVIGNRVWDDLNRDGVQDENEPGISNQELHLEQYIEVDGEFIKTNFTKKTKTNADGYYYFTEVPMLVTHEGQDILAHYKVRVDKLVQHYTITKTKATPDIEKDNNFNKDGTMDDFVNLEEKGTVSYAVSDNTIDLGLVKHAYASVNGKIWLDDDYNGINTENKLADEYPVNLEVKYGNKWVPVQLDDNNIMIEPKLAKKEQAYVIVGNEYNFENLHMINSETLTPYEYRIVVTDIELWNTVTLLNEGLDTDIDNDFTNSSSLITRIAVSETFTLNVEDSKAINKHDTYNANTLNAIDLGLHKENQQVTIGDYIWYDTNQNGLQDAGELGVEGLTVTLNRLEGNTIVPVLNDDGTEVRVKTDSEGRYSFVVDVADYDETSANFNKPYKYVTTFEKLARHELSQVNRGNGNNDSKFKLLKDTSYVKQNAHNRIYSVSSIADLADLDSNNYVDYTSTRNDYKLDGGLFLHDTLRTIGNVMYEDLNEDGVQDSNERGLPGIEVTLYRENQVTGDIEIFADENGNSKLITDENGQYEFLVEVANMDEASNYFEKPYVYYVSAETPTNYKFVEKNNVFSKNDKSFTGIETGEIVLVENSESEINLNSARDYLIADAGFVVYDTEVLIGGLAWSDTNEDGVISDGELPIAGKEITLLKLIDGTWTEYTDNNGNSKVVTDENGYYEFKVNPTDYNESSDEFLIPYEYKVTADREGYERLTTLNAGDDETIDSDSYYDEDINTKLHTYVTNTFDINVLDNGKVDLTKVHNDTDRGIGLITYDDKVLVGGYAWVDANENGIVDEEELPVNEREVTLWKYNELTDEWDDLDKVLTEEGRYQFEVAPTNYDEDADDYLVPYRYRATTVRNGYELWTDYMIGDDETIDSNITHFESTESKHIGLIDEFEISTNDENVIDISSVKSDLDKGFGILEYNQYAYIGGFIWNDENEDGLYADEEYLDDRKVTLYKKVDDQWIEHEDLEGNSTKLTENGHYEYKVEVTNYDEFADDYLVPYEYIVTYERNGNEEWTEYLVGEDAMINSNAHTEYEGLPISKHIAHSDIFVLAETLDDKVLVNTIEDDYTQNAGLIIHESKTIIGDTVYLDVNENGIQDNHEAGIANIEVTLVQHINGKRVDLETVTTDKHGYYQFEVEPTVYDENDENYMKENIYVVKIKLPDGHKHTNADYGILDNYVFSHKAQIIELDEYNNVDLRTLTSDDTIDFGINLVPDPVDTGVYNTSRKHYLVIITSLTALAVMVFVPKKRKEDE